MRNNGIYFPQNESEFYYYCRLLKDSWHKPVIYLEIGSRQGGSLFMASNFLPEKSIIISIDLPNGPWGFEGTELELQRVFELIEMQGHIVHYIMADSQRIETKELLKSIIKDSLIDAIFMDADHSYDGVKRDWELYSDLVDKGGIIVYHDIVCNEELPKVEVWRMWHQLKHEYPYQELVFEHGIGILHI